MWCLCAHVCARVCTQVCACIKARVMEACTRAAGVEGWAWGQGHRGAWRPVPAVEGLQAVTVTFHSDNSGVLTRLHLEHDFGCIWLSSFSFFILAFFFFFFCLVLWASWRVCESSDITLINSLFKSARVGFFGAKNSDWHEKSMKQAQRGRRLC